MSNSRRTALLNGGTLLAALAIACTPTGNATPTPTATRTPEVTATAPRPPSPTASATPTNLPAAPTKVVLSGRLPDLSQPVPPGEAESGRLTVSWESAPGAQGFRLYLKNCEGVIGKPYELPGTDRSYGPFQACRPTGNVGMSAFDARGESAITWVR